jgi:hypothetical protein
VGLTKTTKSNQVSVPADFRKENIPNTSRKYYRLSYLAHSQSLYPWGKHLGTLWQEAHPRTVLNSQTWHRTRIKTRKENKLNATGEFEATFKVSDQVCNTSGWGTVYILESPKWFNNSRENRTEPYTLSNIQFSESSYYIHDSCTVSILPHTNVSSGVIRSTGSSRAKRCRLLHRNTRTSCKKTTAVSHT